MNVNKLMNQSLVVFLFSISLNTFVSCSSDDESSTCKPDLSLQTETSNVRSISANHHAVYTDIVINRSSEQIWAVLTDFEKMPNWSSSFQGLKGDIRNGESIVSLFLNEGKINEFPHTLIYEEGVQFGWSDPIMIFPGIRDNHRYKVEAISPCQSRFIQTDDFSGTDANTTTEEFAQLTLESYKKFNQELKAEVEKN